MKKISLLLLIIAVSFLSGFAFHAVFVRSAQADLKGFKRVTGIGGIFFKCKNPAALREWYRQNLGLQTNQFGAVFEWRQGTDSSRKGFTQWSPFKETTKYFEPSTKDYMINYRVDNLEKLVAELRKNGITVVDSLETYEYGKFIHVLDLEGNKIELWEADDLEYERMGARMGLQTTK